MNSALQITYIIISVLILILVLSQKAKDNGFTTMTGSNSGREVGKTFERKLQVWTTWLVAIYIIFSISFTYLQLKITKDEEAAFVDQDVYNTEVVEAEVLDDANSVEIE